MGIFAKLADNGLYSCTAVVGATRENGAIFRAVVRGPVRLGDWWDRAKRHCKRSSISRR